VPFSWSIVDTPANTGGVCTFFPETDTVALSAGNLIHLTNLTTEEITVGIRTYAALPGGGGIGFPYYSETLDVLIPASEQVTVAPNGVTVPIGGNYILTYQMFPIDIYGTVHIRIENYDRMISGDFTVFPATQDCVSLFPSEVTLSTSSGRAGQVISYQVKRFHCCLPHLLLWDGEQIDRFFVDYHATLSFTVPSAAPGPHELKFVDSQGYEIPLTFTVIAATPKVTISPTRTTVNNWITYNVTGFPLNAPLKITWRRLSGSIFDIATVQTNGVGAISGQFRVPATPGGAGQQITFKAGTVAKTVTFEVVPRIKVNTNPAVRGQYADVSLRGYAKQETVRIRWKKGDGWVTLATVVTSNSGSANVNVKVPAWAPNGANSVRGDGSVFRQQTNTATVNGGPYVPAAATTPTPTWTDSATPASTTMPSTATATVTTVPAETTATPTELAPSETATTEPSSTPSPTTEPPSPTTSTPTETPASEQTTIPIETEVTQSS
jgi:hypothetical protein